VRSGREKGPSSISCERYVTVGIVKIYGKCYSRNAYVEVCVSKSPADVHSFIFRFLSQLDQARIMVISRFVRVREQCTREGLFHWTKEKEKGKTDKGNYLQPFGIYRR